MPSEACTEELETLSAIFLNEIEINQENLDGETQISMVLYPATADDEESRYVTLTLELTLPPDYPKDAPKILFRNPRGLNEAMLEDLKTNMKERCDDRKESQLVYELIDMCKEFLTKNNRPASECPICLFSFTEFDVFYRTRCFHHFHSQCLGNYLKNLAASFKEVDNVLKEKQELTCPVCRECMEDGIDIEKLVESPPPAEELEWNHISGDSTNVTALQEWEGRKKALKKLFEKQKSQGGIIDLTETKKMLVISSPSRDNENPQGGSSNNGSSSTSTTVAAATTNESNPQQRGEQQDQQGGNNGRKVNKSQQQNSQHNKNVVPGNHHHHHKNPPPSPHQNSGGGGSSSSSSSSVKSSTKSVQEELDPEFPDSKNPHRHQQNGRCRRGGSGGGGYNNRDRRRNK